MTTPIGLWEPALARHSLPNGMPLTERSEPGDWTLLDADVVNRLYSGSDEFLWPTDPSDVAFRFCEIYPEGAPTFISAPGAISAGLLAAHTQIGPPSRSLSVRWIAKPTLPAATEQVVGLSAAAIREALDRLRQELNLSARALAKLIGVSTRRYYEFRAGEEPPPERLATIGDRVAFLHRLAARNMRVAADLCRQRTVEVADLLAEGRLDELEGLFHNAVRHRATMLETEVRPTVSSSEVDEVLGIIEAGAFGKIVQFIRYLAPTVDARTSERVAAAMRMEKSIHAVEEGDPVEDDWEFLLVMSPEAVAEFRRRADAILRDEAFGQDSWSAFLVGESERAWADFHYQPAVPSEPGLLEEVAAGLEGIDAWQPDLARYGVDLSLYDRRTR